MAERVIGWDLYGGPVYRHRSGKKFTSLDGIAPLRVRNQQAKSKLQKSRALREHTRC
jgi:hypothetical protein